MARTKDIIEGITSNEMRLSVGYIAKLQKRLYGSLAGYHEELETKREPAADRALRRYRDHDRYETSLSAVLRR